MVLDRLGESLKQALRKITGATFVDERLINEVVKDLQRALLQADVNVRLVLDMAKTIKERSLKERPPSGLTMREHVINIVYEELTAFVGGEFRQIEIKKRPFIIMLVGLFGNGKTTTAGKLANYYKKRGKRVLLVQTDTWRPAAYDQLQQLSVQVGVDFTGSKEADTPVEILKEARKQFKEYDLVIVDTAGRDALSEELVDELRGIHKELRADETLLVMNADVGQAARGQAEVFHKECGVTGVVITKLDGTAKGGGALTACGVTKSPVRFIGVGEKIGDLEEFKPKGFVGRLLGMGDLEALLEKAKEAFDASDAQAMERRVMRGAFNLDDLYTQMEAMRKMGSLKKLLTMIPGLSAAQIPKDALEVQESRLQRWRYVMDSMTKQEKARPEETLNPSRIARIARGSGQPESEVRALLKQYKQAKKMMRLMKGVSGGEKDVRKVMQKMQRKLGKKAGF